MQRLEGVDPLKLGIAPAFSTSGVRRDDVVLLFNRTIERRFTCFRHCIQISVHTVWVYVVLSSLWGNKIELKPFHVTHASFNMQIQATDEITDALALEEEENAELAFKDLVRRLFLALAC